jgi:hypothetical protein
MFRNCQVGDEIVVLGEFDGINEESKVVGD